MSNIINKAVGVILMPYYRIGGRRSMQPLLLARVQTDGSYTHLGGGRISAIVTAPGGRQSGSQMLPVKAANSTEAEWASVALGMRLAIENNAETIGLENDNLGVVAALMHPGNMVKHTYAQYYRQLIYKLAADTMWTGVRWIPRSTNRADDLF